MFSQVQKVPNWRQGVGHRALRKKNFRPKCQRGEKSRFEVSELKWNDNFWINLDMGMGQYLLIHINTISGMNIHKSQLFWGSLGTRVLTHPHICFAAPFRRVEVKSSRAALAAAKVEGASRWLSFGDWEWVKTKEPRFDFYGFLWTWMDLSHDFLKWKFMEMLFAIEWDRMGIMGMGMAQNLCFVFPTYLGGWTSTIYFGLNRKVPGFWPIACCIICITIWPYYVYIYIL